MASTGNLGVEADVATRVDTAIAAGAGDHLPVGQWSGADYRSAMRFAIPAGWAAWTAITKATLTFYISDHQHVGPKNSAIYCSRMNVTSPLWTKGAGSQDCESGFSGSNTTQADDIASVSTDRISFNSGSTANAAKSLDVTAMVRYYQQNGASKIVFVFDNNGSDQYTEIWADEKSGYNATLVIEYEVQSPPTAPIPTAPAAGAVSGSDTPTFSWTHNDPQGDAQTAATVRVYDAAGTTLLFTWPVAGAAGSLVAPAALTRGTSYQWEVATSDAAGYGPYSAKRSLTVKANPVVTISATRKMVYQGGAPRLVVEWTTDQPQASYRVTAAGYDSGVKSGADQSHTLDTLALVNGTAVNITVQVSNTDAVALNGSASRSFTPRWGLTTHKKTLAAVPVNWQTPVVVATVPAGASLVIEYGSAATAGAGAPTAWYSSITSVPKTQFLWWRAWFIPSSTTGPTLDSINVPYDSTVAVLDKWGPSAVWPWENPGGLPVRFSIDTGEAVYGTRSLRCDPNGPSQHYINSSLLKVRAGRSYVLSGLMRSQGNSGAMVQLVAGITSLAAMAPTWPASVLTDWERYKSDVWVATADMDVYWQVNCIGGVAGTTAWFDGLKLEESQVATPWNPATVGATTVDAGGVQIDGTKGGILRYKGTTGGVRDVVEGGANGLKFGGDVDVSSPAAGVLKVNGELQIANPTTVGAQGIQLKAEGAIELMWTGGTPYVDFKDAAGDDFDVRLIMTSPGVLELHPTATSVLKVTGLLRRGGTAFPASKLTNDTFYRTDLGMEFFWDGTRWLSTTRYVGQTSHVDSTAATFNGNRWLPPPLQGCSDIWLERFEYSFFVSGGTALGASHKWVGRLYKQPPQTFLINNINIDSGALSTWRRGGPLDLNVLLGTTFPEMEMDWTKTGTPGPLYTIGAFNYRLVAT